MARRVNPTGEQGRGADVSGVQRGIWGVTVSMRSTGRPRMGGVRMGPIRRAGETAARDDRAVHRPGGQRGTVMPCQWPDVPKVTVSEAGVTCEDCRRTMPSIGSHFRVKHGFPVLGRKRTRCDLLRILGLPLGAKLNSAALCAVQRDLGKDRGAPHLRPKMIGWHGSIHGARRGLRISEAMRQAAAANIRAAIPGVTWRRRIRGRVVVTCDGCGFTSCRYRSRATDHARRFYCDRACRLRSEATR